MDWFMLVLGFLISVAILWMGVRFTFFPTKAVQWLQQIKYKTTGEVDKRARVVSMIMGILLLIVGLYYLVYDILGVIALVQGS
ncbi:MAG: hypothetical protein JXB08_00110 [Bacilli bacterium]|nr:hypothetical protein [Bacilli bacterium]MBN2876790.1 hypothetical protein [Bacilli bacterium]